MMPLQDTMILQIIHDVGDEKPIYFATTVSPKNQIGLEDYLQMEGMTYRLLFNEKEKEINYKKMKQNLIANYSHHYGLVREPGKPILPKHSWNSNDVMSGIFSFNVTKQSAHHEKPDARFWELESYPDAPIIPFGYLTMVYLSVLIPSLYHKIMAKKLIDWDMNYANSEEKT